ncbi:hypothetical protein DFS34DRAFT_591046 [Phlyctochytrium arcticum]|nr:hypothetical protein DFS34DRAFT_591046 [Phlyctochytrium arcticum]
MLTDNPEQDPFDHLQDGLNQLRLRNKDLETKMEEIQAKNVNLVTRNAELQAMLEAKCTGGQKDQVEARLEKIEAQNVDLLTKNTELQATPATLTQGFKSNCISINQEEHPVTYPTKLDNLQHTVGFLSEFRRYMHLHPTRYPDDASQIDLLKSLLCGDALNCVVLMLELNLPELQSFSNLTETLDLITHTVGKGLSWIQQGDESPEEFFVRLQKIQPFIDICRNYEYKIWDGFGRITLDALFYHGLRPEFQKFTSASLPVSNALAEIQRNLPPSH